MISVSEAKQIIENDVEQLPPVTLHVNDAIGLVLAESIYASIDIPAFNQSSMDGYAFRFADFKEGKNLQIAGELPAGSDRTFENLTGKALRIFTGAPVPGDYDTVVMQEKVTVQNESILIEDKQLTKGSNVRPVGAEIKSGEHALAGGTFLSAPAIGFLAGIGVNKVNVIPAPAVTIIVTGDELQQPGKPLQPGQVYDSNSLTLKAALQQFHMFNVTTLFVNDDIEKLTEALKLALQTSDMVLLTGGVSVGDYDFVLKAAALNEVQTMFHKVKQRPGKPLFFGKKQKKIVFGLPGNPSSVLTCFYEYVTIAIGRLTARRGIIKTEQKVLTKSFTKKTALTHFLKAKKEGDFVYPLDAQESFRLSSFAVANCMIVAPESKEEFLEGDIVEIHLLPV